LATSGHQLHGMSVYSDRSISMCALKSIPCAESSFTVALQRKLDRLRI
jgi:hypothetical protein